jgi:S-adenosylmethionine:tRNA ribosyltransferase-isomerase
MLLTGRLCRMRVADFDFELPPENIALRPAVPREAAKLLVVKDGQCTDNLVGDLPSRLRRGDVLVFNNTKVIPAALSGARVGRLGTTPKIEALLHMRLDASRWKAFVKPAKKLEVGDMVHFNATPSVIPAQAGTQLSADRLVATLGPRLRGNDVRGGETLRVLSARVEEKGEAGEITLAFDVASAELDLAIAEVGRVPLPPYIESKRVQDSQDRADYQTIYASESGAVAAPTAGLHFTPNLMKRLQDAGIESEFVTLHVGAGTFLPVKVDDTADHKMHAEWGEVSIEVATRLQAARAEGRRIIAVGTTSLRLLESAGHQAWSGATSIFITPGYKFSAVDGLITNFHLPRSTLFMLVCAFAGTETMKAAYAHAIRNTYRFYSYGDASLLWPAA